LYVASSTCGHASSQDTVVAGVHDGDDHQVVVAGARVRDRAQAVAGHRRDERVVVADADAVALEVLDDLQRGRLAVVLDARLVGDAADQHARHLGGRRPARRAA
jgi:hypothetical protein